jgi:hypothetical protein
MLLLKVAPVATEKSTMVPLKVVPLATEKEYRGAAESSPWCY